MRNQPEQASNNESMIGKMKRMATSFYTGLACVKAKEQVEEQAKPSEQKPTGGDGAKSNTNQQTNVSSGGASPNKSKPANISSGGATSNQNKPANIPNQPTGGGGTKSNTNKPANSSNNKKPIHRDASRKAVKTAATSRQSVRCMKNDEEDPFANVNPKKWKCTEQKFSGAFSYEELGQTETIKGVPIKQGISKFKANPKQYLAMTYQTTMLDWKKDDCQFVYIHRAGSKNYKPTGVSNNGWMTILINDYETLPPFQDNIFPKEHRDNYTDKLLMTFAGKKLLPTASCQAILPGRGMGVCDAPNVKIIGDVDPSDIHQGQVGNCWMLSGISSLAEFDGAVKRLFRKTKHLDRMPMDGPNQYTITLWDIATWTEVDIVVDERLCPAPNSIGGIQQLLASKPSSDGELWVCYLEKALVAHCGGWDKVVGGQCTHAWALLTGCKHQYMISRDQKTGRYTCVGKYNPYERKWARHANSPRDCEGTVWNMPWPAVGGGGDGDLDQEELFMRMCAWDDVNYIVGAGTTGASDKNRTDGVVDNHAYSVIECINDVAGTNVDLIKVRNPWGKGEIENGEFDDDGPGWNKYPQIKRQLNPVAADDGIFWLTKQEFFRHFGTIYLCACDMTEFLDDPMQRK